MDDAKRCYGPCKQTFPLNEFTTNKRARDGLDTYCRPCRKAYNQAYYLRTKERHNPGRLARAQRDRDARFELYREFMQDKSCVVCGESDYVVLEFDHVRDKTADVSKLICNQASWQRVLDEIAKCEIVCANCHRRRTAAAFGWRKGR